MNYPKEELNKVKLQSMVLNVTDSCNLKCKYCFTEPNPSHMSLDTGIKAINWFIQENNKKAFDKYPQSLTISFFGGEPTLRWDEFIYPIVEYVENYITPKFKDKFTIYFSITTNGQLLDEEKISWFKQHRGNFLLSIDGDRESQNLNRPRKDGKDSFDEIDKIIDILLKYQPNITFRSTITPQSVKNLSHDYLFARKKGFQNWFAIPNVREEWDEKSLEILKEEINKICGVMLYDIENNFPVTSFNWLNKTLNYIIFKKTPSHQHYIRCGLGTTSIGVTTDGKFSACQENSTYHDENNVFYIGDVEYGIDEEKHLKLLNQFLKEEKPQVSNIQKEKCEKCYGKYICQVWNCPSTNYALTGDIFSRVDGYCEWIKILYIAAANMILNCLEKDSDNFIDYLKSYFDYESGENR